MRASRAVSSEAPLPARAARPAEGQAHAGDEEAGQRRAADVRGVEHGQVEGERGRQLGGRHQARDERLAGGVVEGGGRGQEGVGAVEDGQALVAGEGQGREGQRRRPASSPASANITRRRSWRSAATPPQSEKTMIGTTRVRPRAPRASGRAGEEVDVPVERHRLHLRAGQRDELRQPEEPEVAVPEDPVGTAQNRNTPKRVSGTGALRAAEIPRARTARVSAGAMMPSSQRRAVE